MKTVSEITEEVLALHTKYLRSEEGGKRLVTSPGLLKIKADLRGADLSRANLRYANLSRANLNYADLNYADLSGANLNYADLSGANLRGANLRGANLSGANLRGADLMDANLMDANLRGADLRGAKFSGANLSGADLDFSCLPLWCGSKGMIVDRRIAAQIAAHFCALTCDDPDYQAARSAILEFAKTSHRASELGLLKDGDK